MIRGRKGRTPIGILWRRELRRKKRKGPPDCAYAAQGKTKTKPYGKRRNTGGFPLIITKEKKGS